MKWKCENMEQSVYKCFAGSNNAENQNFENIKIICFLVEETLAHQMLDRGAYEPYMVHVF